MRIGTHPLHPALVHFPVACWSLGTLGDLIGRLLETDVELFAGEVLLIGTLSAIPAMLAGLLELGRIGAHSAAVRTANIHMLMAMSSWLAYAASLYLRLENLRITTPDAFAVSLSIIGFVLLCITGWLGGRLVYRFGIGVQADLRSG